MKKVLFLVLLGAAYLLQAGCQGVQSCSVNADCPPGQGCFMVGDVNDPMHACGLHCANPCNHIVENPPKPPAAPASPDICPSVQNSSQSDQNCQAPCLQLPAGHPAQTNCNSALVACPQLPKDPNSLQCSLPAKCQVPSYCAMLNKNHLTSDQVTACTNAINEVSKDQECLKDVSCCLKYTDELEGGTVQVCLKPCEPCTSDMTTEECKLASQYCYPEELASTSDEICSAIKTFAAGWAGPNGFLNTYFSVQDGSLAPFNAYGSANNLFTYLKWLQTESNKLYLEIAYVKPCSSAGDTNCNSNGMCAIPPISTVGVPTSPSAQNAINSNPNAGCCIVGSAPGCLCQPNTGDPTSIDCSIPDNNACNLCTMTGTWDKISRLSDLSVMTYNILTALTTYLLGFTWPSSDDAPSVILAAFPNLINGLALPVIEMPMSSNANTAGNTAPFYQVTMGGKNGVYFEEANNAIILANGVASCKLCQCSKAQADSSWAMQEYQAEVTCAQMEMSNVNTLMAQQSQQAAVNNQAYSQYMNCVATLNSQVNAIANAALATQQAKLNERLMISMIVVPIVAPFIGQFAWKGANKTFNWFKSIKKTPQAQKMGNDVEGAKPEVAARLGLDQDKINAVVSEIQAAKAAGQPGITPEVADAAEDAIGQDLDASVDNIATQTAEQGDGGGPDAPGGEGGSDAPGGGAAAADEAAEAAADLAGKF